MRRAARVGRIRELSGYRGHRKKQSEALHPCFGRDSSSLHDKNNRRLRAATGVASSGITRPRELGAERLLHCCTISTTDSRPAFFVSRRSSELYGFSGTMGGQEERLDRDEVAGGTYSDSRIMSHLYTNRGCGQAARPLLG